MGLEAERDRAHGEMRSLRSKKKFAAGKWRETHYSSHEEKEEWIKDYVEWETYEARMRVEDAERAIKQEQKGMRNAEKAGLTTTKPETTFEEMLNAIRDSMSNLSTSDDGEDGEHEDDDEEDPDLGKLCDDDEPSGVMSTISRTVPHRMKGFRQIQM